MANLTDKKKKKKIIIKTKVAIDGVMKKQWQVFMSQKEFNPEMWQKLLVNTKSQIERLMINDVFNFQVINPIDNEKQFQLPQISTKFSSPQMRSLSGSGVSFNFNEPSFKENEILV